MVIKRDDMCCALVLNPDREARKLAQEGLKARGGYCPCKVERIEDNRCICKNTRETGECECGLYVRYEENA